MGTMNTPTTPMDLAHLVQRLEHLAAWLTPGAPRPAIYPAGEAHWLREAARRLSEQAGDLEIVEHLAVVKGPAWRHWGALDTAEERLVLVTSNGPGEIFERIAEERKKGEWVARPLILGRAA